MTASKLAPERAYAEELRALSDDDLHTEGFGLARRMREGDEGDGFTVRRRMELLDAELRRRELSTRAMHRQSR